MSFHKQTTKEIQFGKHTLILETGLVANQTDAAVIVRCGKTVILSTVVSDKKDSPDTDFFPLTVNYIEKYYAGGKIPGGFFKKEGRPSEKEILTSRLIDRPIRPIFVDGYFRNTQVICILLSYDKDIEPDILAMIGASAAITLAKLPTLGTIAGCRVGYINDEFVLNPNSEELKSSKLDLVVAGTEDSVLMVESEVQELSEDIMLNAILFAQKEIAKIVTFIKDFVTEVGGEPSVIFIPRDRSKLYDKIAESYKNKLIEAYKILDKQHRHTAVDDIYDSIKIDLKNETFEEHSKTGKFLVYQGTEGVEMNNVDIKLTFGKLQEFVVRGKVLNEKKRIDGRELDDVRQIRTSVDFLPSVHGSALFKRGNTQVLSVVTLGNNADEQHSESLSDVENKRFALHYNFHGFSAGDAIGPKASGRREIGHGKLAQRAIKAVLPSKESFPYTIRLVAEVLDSDGSTSMATVCSGVMALMATGVPVKSIVSGVAMGLIKEGDSYSILTDIMADEDHLGDMDFKVAGTESGITALQMDIKVYGISADIIKNALNKALKARLHILQEMKKTIAEPRNVLSDNSPRIVTITIPESKIADLIGKSGVVIKSICEKSGAKVEIAQGGIVNIFADNDNSLKIAKQFISLIVDEIPVGKIMDAKVKAIMPFGAIVDIGFDKTGLVHISEIANERVEDIYKYTSEGKIVKVKYIGRDEKDRVKFSMRSVNQETGEDISANQIEKKSNVNNINDATGDFEFNKNSNNGNQDNGFIDGSNFIVKDDNNHFNNRNKIGNGRRFDRNSRDTRRDSSSNYRQSSDNAFNHNSGPKKNYSNRTNEYDYQNNENNFNRNDRDNNRDNSFNSENKPNRPYNKEKRVGKSVSVGKTPNVKPPEKKRKKLFGIF